MLRLAGEGVTAEHIEKLSYSPSFQDSGDLEAATKTVTVTVEATGTGNADYSRALTLAKPSDARITVLRIASRLAVTIDSMTAGQLNCRVYVDAQDADHRLLDLSWTSAGAKLAVVDTHTGNLATIFNLLKDGASHTFYFFFWVNTGNAVISLCQLWEGVGTCNTTYWGQPVLALTYTGFLRFDVYCDFIGTGNVTQLMCAATDDRIQAEQVSKKINNPCALVAGDTYLRLWGSVATDLVYLAGIKLTLRNER